MTRHKTSIVAAVLCAAAAPASADVASLVAALKADTAVEARLEAAKQTAAQANVSLANEEKLYTAQIQNRLGPIRAAIEADATRLGASVATYNEGVARHNANCAGAHEQPVVERCNGEKRHWDTRKAALEGERDKLLDRAHGLDRQMQPYTKRLDEIAAQTQKNAAAIADADRGIAAARARIAQAKARLVDACKTAATPEDVKYCGDLGWSNAKPGLPRLEDVLKAR